MPVKFGTLLMIGFWLSAVGGIALGFLWLKSRDRNPAPRSAIRDSLRRRLESGELDRAEYDRRIGQLDLAARKRD